MHLTFFEYAPALEEAGAKGKEHGGQRARQGAAPL